MNISVIRSQADAVNDAHRGFDFEFLIFLIVCGILSVFFLLYFNRLVASVVSYFIRTWTWHQHRVYIDIQALQISLLGGRIFFTGLRYHGSNETFLVQHGTITWRYWLRRVREAELLASSGTDEDPTSARARNSTLPCRINVNLVGLEWFIYNRSPAYDSILTGLTNNEAHGSGSSDVNDGKDETGLRSRRTTRGESYYGSPISRDKNSNPFGGLASPQLEKQSQPPLSPRTFSASSGDGEGRRENEVEDSGLPFMLQLFPIHFDCEKAAVVMGNDNTKAILITKVESMSGIIDASETRTVDPYRQLFKFQLNRAVIEMKENLDFKEEQATRATRERESALQQSDALPTKSFLRHQRRKALSSLRNIIPYWRRSVESFPGDSRSIGPAASHVPGGNQWQGLSRYLDDQDVDDRARWSSVEYAAVPTILDCPEAKFVMYWDAVARVPADAHRHGVAGYSNNINGSEPPAWNLQFSLKGGTVNYGPWADRLRADLQRVFFPGLSKDALPAKRLLVGEWRVATQFNILIEIEDIVTLRIPVREETKNWRWKGKEPQMKHEAVRNKRKHRNQTKKNVTPDIQSRPAGWFEFKIFPYATITYSMDMAANSAGYKNSLTVDLPSTELWSSVNHDVLWQSGRQRISCDMSNPLGWNSLRNWYFNVRCEEMKMYLLRDHIFLIVDLVDDWGTGPPSDYLVFTPFIYHLNLNLQDLKIYLNINDENIIDKATAMDDNTYLILTSPELKAETAIRLDKFRPSKNAVPFDIQTDTLYFKLHAPQSNTQSAFLNSKELGYSEALKVTGSYEYNATTSIANTDTLILDVHSQSLHAYLHGFVVRYFMVLKDNYFGDYVHFRTLDEYQEQLQLAAKNSDVQTTARPPPKKSNDMDVILSVKLDDPHILLPTNLYSSRNCVQGELATVSIDLRFTNYYMDMELDLSPLSLSLLSSDMDLDSPIGSSSNTQLFIDGLRVFGHRTFGLPPTEPTYLCNWDVSVGGVGGECSVEFLTSLAKAGTAFGFTFDDVENALVPYSTLVFHDVTFVRLVVQSVRLWIHIEEIAFFLSTDAIEVNSNDWARSHYSKRANINIPNIEFSCVDAESASKHKSRNHHPVDTKAYLRTDVSLATIGRKYKFSEARKIQQDLLRREDQRTDRTRFLLLPGMEHDFIPEPVDPPAQCMPPAPLPVQEVENVGASSRSAASPRSRRVNRQSSFLSLNSTYSRTDDIQRQPSNLQFRAVSRQSDRQSMRSAVTGRSFLEPEKRGRAGSTGYSSFYSIYGETPTNENADHSLVAFSSQYFMPHFPLDGVQPNSRDATFPDRTEEDDGFFDNVTAELSDINPSSLSEEHERSSTMIEFPSGVNAFFTPEAIHHLNTLLVALRPTDPEDILDSLQSDTVTEVFKGSREDKNHGDINEIFVRVPEVNLRFLNSSAIGPTTSSQDEQDQYDLLLSHISLVTRTTKYSKEETSDSKTSLQLSLGSAELSVSERASSLQQPQAAVAIQIDDVRASLGTKDVTYFDADIGSIVGSTASGKIEYLAGLIHRTGRVVTDLEHLFTESSSSQENQMKCFVLRLLEGSEKTNDPSFLVRPSAVLRSADKHLRTFDDWKLIMRLRQIWNAMDMEEKAQFMHGCAAGSQAAPPDVADQVVSVFEQWRSWDLNNISNSTLLRKVFKELKVTHKEAKQQYPLLGACRLGEMRLILDPGPKQNNIGLVDFTMRLDKKLQDPSVSSSERSIPLTVLNVCCGDASINLNWELCVLADDLLKLYNRTQTPNPDPPKLGFVAPKAESKAKKSEPENLHIAVELVRGSIELETINLRFKTLGEGLKLSLLTQDNETDPKLSSLLLNCNAVTSVLRSHSHTLGSSQFRAPSLFFSHQLLETSEASQHTIKATASSHALTLAVKQDPNALIEVLDLVLRDEVTQIYRLKNHVPAAPTSDDTVKMTDRLSTVRLNIAMFLDAYSISMPLVQSLTYKISGVVARAACAANFGKEVNFDFDIKENSHEVQINVRDEPRTISLIEVPPTNGRVISRIQKGEHAINVLSSIELIRLDASEIYNLLTALKRPQVSTAIEELQQQIQSIQGHINDIFGNEPQPKATQSASSNLVYTVNLTLAGLQVLAKTSLPSKVEPIAEVVFGLDKVCLQASNRHEMQGPVLRYPEVHLNLRHIGFDIRKGREDAMRSCGDFGAGVTVSARSSPNEKGKDEWSFNFRSDDLDVNLSPETISTIIDVLGYLGTKIKDLDASRELDYLRKLRQSKPRIAVNDDEVLPEYTDILESVLGSVIYRFELRNIRASWDVSDETKDQPSNAEDLVLSIKLIEFGTRTRRSARLAIENLQLQTVPPGQDKNVRSLHSALLPQVTFNIAYYSKNEARRLAFQATGESLDLRLTSGFIVPAAHLVKSISLSAKNVQQASAQWNTEVVPAKKLDSSQTLEPQRNLLGNKRLENLLIDVDFDGAVVYISSKRTVNSTTRIFQTDRASMTGKYGQFNADDTGSAAVLRSPGLAWKAEYRDNGREDPTLYGEIKVDASSNILYPSVVPLVMDIISSVKEVVSDESDPDPAPPTEPPALKPEKTGDEDNILTADPSAVLGRMKLNLGLRICRQEFSLSCQPIARVSATTSFESFYFTLNTVASQEQGNFFAMSGVLNKPQASVQHVYSRESTGSFEVDTVTLSFMNSKHVSGTSGLSAILNVSPMKVSINAKQVQDFLLFREIWYPKDLRRVNSAPVAKLATETSQGHLVQRYQQVAATGAFPWTATIYIAALDVSVDMGQAIGKSVFEINNFWVSSKKTSDWEQNLCLGFDKIGIDCTGRLSGFVALQHFKLRSSIQWPRREEALNETPLVQASLAFNALRIKAGFDYQAFLIADVTSLEFLMYNVREKTGDRLVATFNGEAVQVFGTTSSAAQAVALYQAIQKFLQERRENFESNLKDIEKFMRRQSSTARSVVPSARQIPKLPEDDTMAKSPISLDTDVVVTLKALNLGVFPSTFSDHQVFKMEALNAYARFAASIEHRRIHSILRMTLGQLRIGLAGVRNIEAPKTLSEMSVEDVVQRSTGARGGTILKVPRVEAAMETWQIPNSNHIDYIFKSAFEGKVEVGWNYSRISYIRGMWAKHSKSLEHIWGRQLPMAAAVKITGVPEAEEEQKDGEQQKITAEVNVPQSKYEYLALEPPIIETPQLRDMGEATPPLEWIGLNRDRLPNLTHQIVIVSLLELAGEVEDAYSRILGSS